MTDHKSIAKPAMLFILSVFALVTGIGVIILNVSSAMFTGFEVLNILGIVAGIISIIISYYCIFAMGDIDDKT